MKITIHNLGIITEAEIDLKPLTIFVGPNNTGKTWMAYTLGSIFSSYGFLKYKDAYIQGDVTNIYPPLDKAIEQVTKNGIGVIDLVQFTSDYGEAYFNDVARFASQWMPGFLGTDLASFEDLDIAIDFSEIKAHILERILNSSISRDMGGSPTKKSLLTLRKTRGNKNLFVYIAKENISSDTTSVEGQLEQDIPVTIIKYSLIEAIFPLLHRAIYPFVYILPTERTTFIAYPPQRRRRETEEPIQNQFAQERRLKSTPMALSHFFLMMESASNREIRERILEKNARSNQKIKEYIQLAELLEKQILGGKVSFSQTDAVYPHRDILFQPTDEHMLELTAASSMVKELSPLLFYLRHLAIPGELIIIDEPEMNLHPGAQVKIIELLTILVNAKINVLITTHSPYIVDHLANLIKANESENKEKICNDFYLKSPDAFISKDKVSVYLFNEGQVTKAIDAEGLIELDTFGQVSDQISEIYFNL